MGLIALEEHFLAKAVHESFKSKRGQQDALYGPFTEKLLNLGDQRIQEMDKGGISLQVLSHAPMRSIMTPEICHSANIELYQAIQSLPSRFTGFAMLPMADPEAASSELKHCVEDLGFVGALVPNTCGCRFYDDTFFWPVFSQAQDLDVPIYIHPAFPPEDMEHRYQGNFPDSAARMMSTTAWGWHSDNGLHFLRLFASGLFDKLPKLKIVLGHMGEMLPFMFHRLTNITAQWETARTFQQVWNENIWFTTSGMFSLPALTCLLGTARRDHILFSVDYPYASNEQGLRFVDEIRQSGLLSQEEFEMFTYRNAEKLLRIKAIN